ncbi:MAG: hypothetical protein CM1200mP34_5810 [Verrucomicrobiales bacterium]|nr:MAG: hypothetical protein CM1200mP34_5810 [Verrucomicrobiales bacterium]
MAIALAVFAITMGFVGGGHIRFVFFPPVEGDNVAASITMPLGTTMEETQRAVKKVEEAAIEVRRGSTPRRRRAIRASCGICSVQSAASRS